MAVSVGKGGPRRLFLALIKEGTAGATARLFSAACFPFLGGCSVGPLPAFRRHTGAPLGPRVGKGVASAVFLFAARLFPEWTEEAPPSPSSAVLRESASGLSRASGGPGERLPLANVTARAAPCLVEAVPAPQGSFPFFREPLLARRGESGYTSSIANPSACLPRRYV